MFMQQFPKALVIRNDNVHVRSKGRRTTPRPNASAESFTMWDCGTDGSPPSGRAYASTSSPSRTPNTPACRRPGRQGWTQELRSPVPRQPRPHDQFLVVAFSIAAPRGRRSRRRSQRRIAPCQPRRCDRRGEVKGTASYSSAAISGSRPFSMPTMWTSHSAGPSRICRTWSPLRAGSASTPSPARSRQTRSSGRLQQCTSAEQRPQRHC